MSLDDQSKAGYGHRLAQTNYPIRVGSFGYSFVIVVALLIERGTPLSAGLLAFPAFALLAYPHLAYLHARISRDPRRAELDNLLADAVLLGIMAAQTGMALWLFGGIVIAICINNAVCAGAPRLVAAVGLLAASTLVASWAGRAGFQPDTGPLVTMLCIAGISAYVSAVGLVMHSQRERLVSARNALARSEDQFRFIAEHAGDYVAVLDSRGRIRYASGAYQERFDPNVVRNGAHWTGVILPSDRERARDFLTAVLLSGKGARLRLNFAAPAQGGHPLELDCAANVVEQGEGAGSQLLVVTARQPTALEEAMDGRLTQELRRHHAGYGVLVTSALGRIELVSPRMGEMLGYGAAELLGKTVEEISEAIPASDGLLEDVWRALEADGICQRKLLLIEKSGRLKLAWANVVQIRSEDGAARFAWTLVDDPVLTVAQQPEGEPTSGRL